MGRYAYQGRHRTPEPTGTAVRTVALSAGVVAAVMVGSAAPALAAGSSSDPWYRLRVCESGDNYKINTGNGYYGAYQFNAGTWRAYGGRGLPHQASPAEQDHRAKLLYSDRGWAPWPGCSRRLGLRNDPAYGRTSAPGTAKVVRKPATIAGPATAGLRAKYRIRGTARPNSRIVVHLKASSSARWASYPKRVNRTGRWSIPWRARTDYRYYVVGDTRSATRATLVRTTAAASASTTARLAAGGRPVVTVGGTARPNSKMILFVRSPAGRWGTWRRFGTGPTGRWALKLEAPASSFRYYAKSANGLRSTIRTIQI